MRWMFREQLWEWSAGGRGTRDGLHLAAGVDLDALGLGLFGLGDQDAQHPVLHRSLNLVRHDLGGQGDRAAESAGGALDSVVLLLRGLAGELALALDGQQAVLQGDLQVVELDPWQLDGHQVGILAFGDVQRWRPGRGAWANSLSIWVWARSGSPSSLGRSGGRRLGDNAVRVRATGCTFRVTPPPLNTV